jgi:hypothetical protein
MGRRRLCGNQPQRRLHLFKDQGAASRATLPARHRALQATYDLRRLRRKNMIERLPHSNR